MNSIANDNTIYISLEFFNFFGFLIGLWQTHPNKFLIVILDWFHDN